MRKVCLLALLLLAGCAAPKYTVTVYGKSGAQYTAPSLCEALLACQRSGHEASCFYEKDAIVNPDGTHTDGAKCVEVPGK